MISLVLWFQARQRLHHLQQARGHGILDWAPMQGMPYLPKDHRLGVKIQNWMKNMKTSPMQMIARPVRLRVSIPEVHWVQENWKFKLANLIARIQNSNLRTKQESQKKYSRHHTTKINSRWINSHHQNIRCPHQFQENQLQRRATSILTSTRVLHDVQINPPEFPKSRWCADNLRCFPVMVDLTRCILWTLVKGAALIAHPFRFIIAVILALHRMTIWATIRTPRIACRASLLTNTLSSQSTSCGLKTSRSWWSSSTSKSKSKKRSGMSCASGTKTTSSTAAHPQLQDIVRDSHSCTGITWSRIRRSWPNWAAEYRSCTGSPPERRPLRFWSSLQMLATRRREISCRNQVLISSIWPKSFNISKAETIAK